MATRIIELGEWRLEPARNRLSRGDEVRRIEPRAMDLLCYLTAHPGEVLTADQLLDVVWTGRVVGDGAVHTAIKQVREALGDDARHPCYIETIPRRGYRLIAPTVDGDGRPDSAPQRVPERARRIHLSSAESAVAVSEAVSNGRSPRPVWWAVAAVVLAAALIGPVTLVSDGMGRPAQAPVPQAMRTAMFAFTAAEEDAAAAQLRDAIANNLIDAMDVLGLPLVAPNSFAGTPHEHRIATARSLGVAYVLDGDIRREGNDLVVSARIEALESRTMLWAESFRGHDARLAPLSMRVAALTADTLRCASPDLNARGFGGVFDVDPDDVDSLRMLLRACSQIRTGSIDENRALFHTLVTRYPRSAELHAAFALTLANSIHFLPRDAHTAQLAEAEREAQQALTIDAANGQAYMALVDIRRAQRAPGTEVGAILREALGQRPDHATLNSYYGKFLLDTGRVADAEPYLRSAALADPLSPRKKLNLASELVVLGRYADAARVLDAALQQWHIYYLWRLRALLAVAERIGHQAEVLALVAPDDLASGESACWQDLESAFASSSGLGGAAIDRCVDAAVLSSELAMYARVALGDVESTFAAAARVRHWTDSAARMLLSARADAVQRDRRFLPLMQRLGMIDVWIQSDNWPDFCRRADLPYDCRVEAQRVQRGDL